MHTLRTFVAHVTPHRIAAALLCTTILACSAFAPGPAVPISEEPETGTGTPLEGGQGSTIPAGPSLNGCAQSSYVDRSGVSDDRTIYFGGTGPSGPFAFSPACMVVSPGQTVTFSGDFSVHPLSPGSNPESLTTGTNGNPIVTQDTNDVAATTVKFAAGGTFPFFCQNHYAAGMYGAVRVR